MDSGDAGGIRHADHAVDHRRNKGWFGAWAADALDTAAATADKGAVMLVEAIIEHRIFRIDHRQAGVVPLIADIAAQGRRGATGTGTHYDMLGYRERFAFHLAEDAVGDVVVAAPVGGPFSVGELIHIVAVQLFRQLLGDGINLRRMVDEVTTPAVERDLLNLAACGTGRHDGNKRQANQPGEVSFGYRGTAG
ncbi:hypothetical protein D3C81_1351580 [compost metagenome]